MGCQIYGYICMCIYNLRAAGVPDIWIYIAADLLGDRYMYSKAAVEVSEQVPR